MFSEIIENTPFTHDAADEVFGKISGSMIHDDNSFLATLRALVYPRMQEDDVLELSHHSFNNVEDAKGHLDSISDWHNKLVILEYSRFTQDKLGAVKEMVCHTEGWVCIEKATAFFQKFTPVICMVNPDNRICAVITGPLRTQVLHFLQIGIVVFLPWYFPPEQGLSTEERALIDSLREKDSVSYTECLGNMAKKYDFRTSLIRRKLAGFESRADERILQDTVERIDRTHDEINDLQERFNKYMRDLNELNIRRLGLQAKIAENRDAGGEMMEYFLANKSLVLEEANGSRITFGVLGYMTYFDPDLAQATIDNPNSYFYTAPNRNGLTTDDLKRFYTAVFLSRTIRIRYCAKYDIGLDGDFNGRRHEYYGYEYDGYMPNPHIEYHRCLGNYRETLTELMRNHEYIGAIEQCIASSRSLTLNDISAEEGIRDLFKNDARKCVELPDGKVVTAREAVKYLKAAEEG